MTTKFDYTVIATNPHPHLNPQPIAVYGIGRYERSSVLAGQTMRVFLDSFDSIEDARAAFPDADEGGLPPRAEVPRNPPPDFDPLDAGEVWSEDDY